MIRQTVLALLSAFFLCIAPFLAHAVEKPKEDREGGIIGTGIVGIITELGSIIVNGQRVTFPQDAVANSDIGGRMATSLTPGETVVVVARKMPADWQAESIHLHYPIIGPVALKDGALTVLGVDLDLSDAVDETHLMSPRLKNGDWIAVSGLWKGETLMVSKLTAVDPQKSGTLSGSYMPGSVDTFMIGGARISGLDLTHVKPGDSVTVTGRPEPEGLKAQTVRIGLFSGPMETIIAQGYMSQPTASGLYTILGSGVVSFTDQPQMIDTQTAGVFCISLAQADGMYAITPVGSKACN